MTAALWRAGVSAVFDSGEAPVGAGDGPGGDEEADDDKADVVEVDAADPGSDWGLTQPALSCRKLMSSMVPARNATATDKPVAGGAGLRMTGRTR